MPNESDIISHPKGTRRFKLEHTAGVVISDDDIIADMRRVAVEHGVGVLPSRLYESFGKYSHTTASRRFGSWNAALKAAGLQVNKINKFVSDEDLFANIESMWLTFGRQPRKRDLVPPLSRHSVCPYIRRFGSWRKSLEAFVYWANTTDIGVCNFVDSPRNPKRTPRDPNSALRWRVANRDSFRCQHCGKSPALNAGVQLHIDHIIPWSKGGETVLENLQTLCSECNLGKGTQDQVNG